MAMNTRKIAIGAVLAFIGLPVVLVVIVGVSFYALMSFYALNRTNGRIVSSGQKREYLLYVPKGYDSAKPAPLVISLHAAALWPATQREASHWNKVADEHGFIVVYPSGTTLSGRGTGVLPFRAWLLRPEAVASSNVRFISELIDTLEAAYNIDPTRIYANGFSNGGAMAVALSCRLSHRIAAVGTVSAAQDRPWSWCEDSRPVPLINFHGTADLVPYNGGKVRASPRPFPSVSAWTANWALRNRCGPNPIESVAAADVTRLEYTNCANDAAVVLYTVQGGGHSWPGGKPMPAWIVGPTNRSIDATSLMWAFFREHHLRRN
jgi:polyhydroxybutyrate depolymerase